VQLGSAGTLYIEPNTNLTVTFDKTNVEVKVAAGSAFVAAQAGVMSTVINPDGTTAASDPGTPPVPKMSHKKKKAAWIAVGVIIPVVIIVAIVATNGS
jgi:hypothetical protein